MSNSQQQDFGILLNMAFNSFRESLERQLAKQGFEDIGAQYGYVFRCLAREPRNLRYIANQLKMTPQGALKIIKEMVSKGYVSREAHESDGRIKYLRLTPRASQAVACARRFHARYEMDLSQRLGSKSVQNARTVLEAISENSDSDSLLRPI